MVCICAALPLSFLGPSFAASKGADSLGVNGPAGPRPRVLAKSIKKLPKHQKLGDLIFSKNGQVMLSQAKQIHTLKCMEARKMHESKKQKNIIYIYTVYIYIYKL